MECPELGERDRESGHLVAVKIFLKHNVTAEGSWWPSSAVKLIEFSLESNTNRESDRVGDYFFSNLAFIS